MARKKVNRPRSSGGNRGAKWALAIALVLLVGMVVVLARLTAENNSRSPAPSTGQTDARSVEKPPEKESVSPEFQFYTLLPEEGNQPPRARESEKGAMEEAPGESTELVPDAHYLVQAGSFSKVRDAEARKAELALLGAESRVDPVDVGGQRYHRVILGPLPAKEINALRRQLEEAGIETTSPRRHED
ncbi:MAG: SPOR domain-containing protein [Guyparkeria sp.]|uniref:SPOR domain-containing protein n=1 Tax=Guyparkeria sp. TaxID=2035736 RepID=UPI00397B16E5